MVIVFGFKQPIAVCPEISIRLSELWRNLSKVFKKPETSKTMLCLDCLKCGQDDFWWMVQRPRMNEFPLLHSLSKVVLKNATARSSRIADHNVPESNVDNDLAVFVHARRSASHSY